MSTQFHVPLPYPFRMATEILQNSKSIALIPTENGQHCLLFLMLDLMTTTVPISAEKLLSLHGPSSHTKIEKDESIKKVAVIMQSESHREYFQLQLSPYLGVHLFDHVPSNTSEYPWVIGLHLKDTTVIPRIPSCTLLIASTMPKDDLLDYGFYDPFDYQDYKANLEGYRETIIRYMADNVSIPEFGNNIAFGSMALATVLAIQERMDRKRRFVFLGYDEGSALLEVLNTAFQKLSLPVTLYKNAQDVDDQKSGAHLIYAKSVKELLTLKHCDTLLLPSVCLTTERIKDSLFYTKTRLCEHVFLTPSDHATSLQSFLKAQPPTADSMNQVIHHLSDEEYTIRLILGLEDAYEKPDGKVQSFDTLRDLCDSNLQVQKIVFSTSESMDIFHTKKEGGYSITFYEKWTKPLDVCFMKYIAMAQRGMYRVPCLKAYESAMIETLKNNVITNAGRDTLEDYVYSFPKYIPKAFEKTNEWTELMESRAPKPTPVYVTTIHVDKADQTETLALITLHSIDTANIPPEMVYLHTSDPSPTQITFRSWTPDHRAGIGYQPIETLREVVHKEAVKTTEDVDDDLVLDTFTLKERSIADEFQSDRAYEPIFLDANTMKRVKDFQKAFCDIVCGSLHVGITQELNTRSYFLLPMTRLSLEEWDIDWKTVDRLLAFPQVTGWEWIMNAINYVQHFLSRNQPIPSTTFNSLYDDLIANYGTIRSQPDETANISDTIQPHVEKLLASMFMITRHNLHKYAFLNLRLDIQPDHVMTGGHRKKPRLEKEDETFREYVQRQGYIVSHPHSCMFEGKLFSRFSNHALRTEEDYSSRSAAQFVPDAVIVAPCSAGIWQIFKLLPTLFYGLLNSMAANDLRKVLAIPYVNVTTLITALTSPPVDKTNNFERLEFLGDGFLKKAVTYDLYNRFPDADEGSLTGRRAWRVSNAYLKDLAIKLGIPKFINNTALEPERWAPSWTTNVLWKSLEQNVEKQGFSLKIIADIMEAIIGTVYQCAGNDYTDLLLHKFGILSDESFLNRYLLDIHMDDCQKRTYFNQDQPIENGYAPVTADSEIAHVQRAFGYQPKNNALFEKAFTASNGQAVNSYERLEFLGDAILDWFIVRYIYLSFPNYSPGMMTDLKHHIVNNEAFARISVSLRLHFPLLRRAPALKAEVDKYVEFLMTKDDAKKPLDTQYYGPKYLGDVFESVVGALFIDMDCNLVRLWDLIRPLIKSYLFDPILHDQLENEKYRTFVRGARHPVRLFQELLQRSKIKLSAIEYRFDDHDPKAKNEFHCRLFVNGHLVSEATSKTKSATKRRVAELGIRKIENNFGYVRQLKKPKQESEFIPLEKPFKNAPLPSKPVEFLMTNSLPTLISQDLDEEVDMDLETPLGSPILQSSSLAINSLFDELDILLEDEKLFMAREPSPEML